MSKTYRRQSGFAAFSPIADTERAKLRVLREEIARDVQARALHRQAIERARTEAALDDAWKLDVKPLRR